MASGTSFALPRPTPTRPFESPTTTSAEKLKRRPPFTTFATRLMWTTRSLSSRDSSSFPMLMERLPECSELEARRTRRFGECAHAAVVHVATAVEYDLLHAL